MKELSTWKGLKSIALTGPVCLSGEQSSPSSPVTTLEALYICSFPLSHPPTITPFPEDPHTNLWKLYNYTVILLSKQLEFKHSQLFL